jgi:hypothetical protein
MLKNESVDQTNDQVQSKRLQAPIKLKDKSFQPKYWLSKFLATEMISLEIRNNCEMERIIKVLKEET